MATILKSLTLDALLRWRTDQIDLEWHHGQAIQELKRMYKLQEKRKIARPQKDEPFLTLAEVEAAQISAAMERCPNIPQAARLLGINETTLRRKLKCYLSPLG